MRRVAVVAPDFPPSILPSALRLRFITRHLHEFGWEPVVITADPKHYQTGIDPESDRLMLPDMEVIRTPALPSWLTRRIGVSDIGLRTLWHHWRALSELCRGRSVDLVFTSVPPAYQMVLGRLARARFGIPYVVDYQDPWTSAYHGHFPVQERPGGRKWAVAHALARRIEPFALRRVSHITAVSRGTTEGMAEMYPWLAHLLSTEIPLGAEPEDFDFVRQYPRPNAIFEPHDGLFHLSYVGRGGIDMLPAFRAVFEAVRLGRARAPQVFSRLRMHLVGTTYAPRAEGLYQILPLAREMGLADIVDEHPARVTYLDSIQLLLDSDGVLAVGSELSHYTASKIFPLILCGRPLLAVFHRASTVVRILHETGAGALTTFNEDEPPIARAEALSSTLEGIISSADEYHQDVKRNAFEPYTARAMAERLASVFDRCLVEQAAPGQAGEAHRVQSRIDGQ